MRVKEEHLDVATADKALSPELPVPVEMQINLVTKEGDITITLT